MDFAVPELITILIPKRLAKISVVRRPSIKLKITPRIHPNENPLKNIANILYGVGSAPNATSDNSATAMETSINFRRFSLFNSEINFDTYKLGYQITCYLNDSNQYFIIKAECFYPVKSSSCERFAQCINQ